jgi:hypothetical protein
MRIAIACLAASLCCAWGQEIKLPPGIDKLAEKAKESTEVNLDGNMLQIATKFLSEKDPDQAKARKIALGLKGVVVRAFEFAKEGEYSQADIDALRAPLQGWSKVVSVKSKGENTEVYFKPAAAGQIDGLVVIAAEPRELTYVQIAGTLSPEDIADLSGQFGIPQIPGVKTAPRGKAAGDSGKGKDEE